MRGTTFTAGQVCARRTALAALVVALVGCGSTVSGHETKPAGEPNLDGVSVGHLQTGNYPTTPVPPMTTSNSGPGVVLEGQRMAGYVVDPSEVDATLTEVAGLSVFPLAGATALGGLFGDTRTAVASAHGFVAGFSTARYSAGIRIQKSLLNVVMRFPDPPSAAAAVGEMNAADPYATGPLAQNPPPRHPTTIPRYPNAAAYETDDTTGNGISVESFTAHGPYVLAQWIQTLGGLDAATALAAKTLDLQGPRIDQFVPTDLSALPDLPIDPTGLFAHTLQAPKGMEGPFEGVYAPQGALHLEADPAAASALFTAAGVDAVSLRGEAVYRAKDSAAAQQVVDGFAADWGAKSTPVDGVPGMPGARCLDRGAGLPIGEVRYVCFARADRYAFAVSSDQAEDARQQTAAQYLVLARS